MLSPDTSPEMEAMLLDMMQRTPSWRKMEIMDQLNAMAREFAMSGLRKRHPTAGEAELRRRLADLLAGPRVGVKSVWAAGRRGDTGWRIISLP